MNWQLRALRDRAMLTQEELAERVGVATLTVKRWEHGQRPYPVHLRKLCAVFGASSSELGYGSDDPPGRPVAPGPALTGHSGHQIPAGDADLAAMEVFRLADRQIGGGHLYGAVVSYLTDSVSPRLLTGRNVSFAAATSLTQMAGWMAHDSGRDNRAGAHFDRAWELSQIVDAVELRADVAAAKAHLDLHFGRSDRAVEMAQAGRVHLNHGARHPGLEARLSAMEARGLAALGRRVESARMLSQAEAFLGRRDGDASPWVAPFDEASLASEMTHGLRAAADFAAARRAAERVLLLRDGGRLRSRALAQLALAAILLDQPQPDPVESAAYCLQVVEGTATVASSRVGRELRELRRRLQPHRAVRAIAECLDHVDAALAQRRALYDLTGGS